MKQNFKVALVGCGTISKNHLTALNSLQNVEIVALCDIDHEKAVNRVKEFELNANVYTCYSKMLKRENPDVVHICTPHYLHSQMAIEALEQDIYVFLEKPVAISCEEIRDIIAAEQKSRASACVCFQNRFSPSIIKAAEFIAEDGGADFAYATVFWDRGEKYYTESGWRGSYATEGGGVMINQAVHTLDLLCQLLGEPETVSAKIANHHLRGIIEVEDSCGGMIRHKGGAISNFYATTAASGISSTVLYVKTCQERVVEVRNFKLYLNGVYIDTKESDICIGKACYGSGHAFLIEKFYDALLNEKVMPVTVQSASDAVKLLLAAYRSNGEDIII